jgi:hypothetical protein
MPTDERRIAPFGSGNEMANALCMWQTLYYVWIYGAGWQRIPITDWEQKTNNDLLMQEKSFFVRWLRNPRPKCWIVVHGQFEPAFRWSFSRLGSHNTKKWTIKWSGSSVMTHIIYNITLKFMWSFSVPWCSKIILPYCQAKYHFVLLLWNKILKWM